MLLASYARASGALCRNERLGLDARVRDRRASGAGRAVACRPCVSGVGRELHRSRLWRVPLARCDTCPRAAHVVSREMRILLVRCLAGCGCPRWAAAIRMNLRWPSNLCLRLARAVLRLLAVAVPAPRFPHGGFHLRERYADVRA